MAEKRNPFGTRLAHAIGSTSPLCVGIDPSRALLNQWGLDDSASGAETMGRSVVAAAAGVAAAVKPQIAFFERYGARGYHALERILQDARDQEILVVADVKRGDIDSTMAAYGDAWLRDESPLAVDAMTVTAYLGLGAMEPVIVQALENGRGLFVVVASSNPEGRMIQSAITESGTTVEASLLDELALHNAQEMRTKEVLLGSLGAVVGATRSAGELGLSSLNGPFLVPGVGAQGATPEDVGRLFDSCLSSSVLVNASRSILGAGPEPSAVKSAARELGESLNHALRGS